MAAVTPELINLITLLTSHRVSTFIAGGALGFDTLAARTVLKLRRSRFPNLRLVLALPCSDQADRWSADNQAVYREIMAQADEVCILSPTYQSGCMQKRNRYMVDRSSYLIGYVSRCSGGSFFTMQYARSQGLHIKNLAPDTDRINAQLTLL